MSPGVTGMGSPVGYILRVSPSEAPFVLGRKGAGPTARMYTLKEVLHIPPLCPDQTRHHTPASGSPSPCASELLQCPLGSLLVRPGTQCQASADPGQAEPFVGESVCHLRFVSTLRLLAE